MKVIYRNINSIVVWGTDDNSAQVQVVNNNFVVNGVVVVTNVNENEFSLVEDENATLCNPFFVGYATYIDGYLAPTESYLLWNDKQKTCIQEVRLEYYLKSQDPQYTEEERQSFVEYYTLLDEILNIEFLSPSWTFPCPPDEMFPYYPPCFF